MRRPLFLIGTAVAAVTCVAQAIASTASVGVLASIQNSVGVTVIQPLVLPTVSATAISTGATVTSGGLTAVSGSSVVSSGTATSAVSSGGATQAVGGSAATSTINAP